MNHLKGYFKKHPVIASVRNMESLQRAINSQVIALFILHADIFALQEIMDKARSHDKLIFLHLDLIEGVGRDNKGVKYLAQNNLCDGIVTTKSGLFKAAKKEGLMAIQRLFLIDSDALKTGEYLIKKNQPDAVEILPGIASAYFIDHVDRLTPPVIAGGLIRTREEVEHLLAKGILAVSSSNPELWEW